MNFSLITPVIITLNEELNLRALLNSLAKFPRVIVVDSFSTDQTQTIAKSFSNTAFLERPFDNFANQWNYGVAHAGTDWILALDADYGLSPAFLREVEELRENPQTVAYSIPFRYAIFGQVLRCGIYPSRVILFRKNAANFFNDGHSQAINPKGEILLMKQAMIHDDWKDMSRWLKNQITYGRMERDKLLNTPPSELTWPDRLRLSFPLAPLAMIIYILIYRRGILDGWFGMFYTIQRVVAELIIAMFILEGKLNAALGRQGQSLFKKE